MKNIDEKFVKRVNFKSLNCRKVRNAIENDLTRIIEITNCFSISEFASQESFLEFYNQTSTLFVIIFKFEKSQIDERFLDKLNDCFRKSTIVQIVIENKHELFFKTTDIFRKVDIDELLLENFERDEERFDFAIFCNLLHFMPAFGQFDGDILKTRVNALESSNKLKFVEWAIQHRDFLSLRFILLFIPAVNIQDMEIWLAFEFCAANGLMQAFTIMLEDSESIADNANITPLEFEETSFLMTLSYASRIVVFENMLRCGVVTLLLENGKDIVDVDENLMYYYDFTITDVVWKSRDWELILKLLEANAAFPSYNFEEVDPANEEILELITALTDFHKDVRSNNRKGVAKFVSKNPKIKCAYDTTNRSALSVALFFRSYDVYAFLLSEDFSTGIDGDHDCILEKYNIYELEDLKLAKRKYFPSNKKNHIMRLVSKSRLCFGSNQHYFKIIQKWYETLDSIEEVHAIIKLIALSEKIDVVFDFNRNTVDDMDPTQMFNGYLVLGRTIYSAGNIMIGANGDDTQVLAVIAHEFTHYVLYMVYGNAEPFYPNDCERMLELETVIRECKATNINFENTVIADVFTYPQELYFQEIIVRVPQLRALHVNDPSTLSEIIMKYGALFDFFTKRTLPDVERKINFIEKEQQKSQRNQVVLNRTRQIFSIIHTIVFCFILYYTTFGNNSYPELTDKNFMNSVPEIKSIDDLFEILYPPGNVFIRSDTPEVLVKHFHLNSTQISFSTEFGFHDSFEFFTINQFFDPKNRQKIEAATRLKLKIIVYNDGDTIFNSTEFSFFLDELKIHTGLVLIAEQEIILKEFRSFYINIEFGALTERSQINILNKSFELHGHKIYLKDIVKVDDINFPLKEIIQLSGFVIEPQKLVLPSYFIKRRAFVPNSFLIVDIVKYCSDNKIVVLADDAGWGKSTYATWFAIEYQKRVSLSWTVFVELKRFTNVFIRDGDPDEIIFSSKFFSQKLLKFPRKLEKKLFREFYKDQKVMFVFDGFDEISPNYKKFVLKMLTAVKESGNRMLIATRTYLVEELVANAHVNRIKLHNFVSDEQEQLLVNIWQQYSANANVDKLRLKANRLIVKIKKMKEFRDIELFPLQLMLIAETQINADELNLELDMYSILKTFIIRKIDIWNQKGLLAVQDNTKLQLSGFNILQIHEKIAIEYFFTRKSNAPSLKNTVDKDIDVDSLGFPEITNLITEELILRAGLVKKDSGGEFLFFHQSYAEFLVTEFLVRNMVTKSPLNTNDSIYAIFFKIILENHYPNIRKFLERRLEDSKAAIASEVFTRNMRNDMELLRGLGQNPSENSINTFKFILKSVNDVNIITEILLISLKFIDSEEIFDILANTIKTYYILNGEETIEQTLAKRNYALQLERIILYVAFAPWACHTMTVAYSIEAKSAINFVWSSVVDNNFGENSIKQRTDLLHIFWKHTGFLSKALKEVKNLSKKKVLASSLKHEECLFSIEKIIADLSGSFLSGIAKQTTVKEIFIFVASRMGIFQGFSPEEFSGPGQQKGPGLKIF